MPPPLILALETSCDETAVAIVRGPDRILASEIASQIELHRLTGGVVPEAASRQHVRDLGPLLGHALSRAGVGLEEIDAFAATTGPGLASSLMIGAAAAKGLALGRGRPFIGVNHLEGHLLSPFMGTAGGVRRAVGLIVSGGHTLLAAIDGFRKYRRLGGTLDDAAGEAFDKVAKLMGLPYPGGPEIDRLARGGNRERFGLPRSMLNSGDFNFSFSGLKTAARIQLDRLGPLAEADLPDLCASFQEAVVEVLVTKTMAAARLERCRTVALSGGVSLNTRLRRALGEACAQAGIDLLIAPAALCTDNAAMIGGVAAQACAAGIFSPLTEDIDPNRALPFIQRSVGAAEP